MHGKTMHTGAETLVLPVAGVGATTAGCTAVTAGVATGAYNMVCSSMGSTDRSKKPPRKCNQPFFRYDVQTTTCLL